MAREEDRNVCPLSSDKPSKFVDGHRVAVDVCVVAQLEVGLQVG